MDLFSVMASVCGWPTKFISQLKASRHTDPLASEKEAGAFKVRAASNLLNLWAPFAEAGANGRRKMEIKGSIGDASNRVSRGQSHSIVQPPN